MAQGIKIPLTVIDGRLAKLRGDEYIKQLIMIHLGDGQSENPFQYFGIDQGMIFKGNTEVLAESIEAKVILAFESLEFDQLASLMDLDVERHGHTLDVVISYVDLETGHRADFSIPITGG